MIYQYSIIHFKRLIEMERESEETYAFQNYKIELYEYKWEKCITKYQVQT